MTVGNGRVRYFANADITPDGVEKRVKGAAAQDEESGEYAVSHEQYTDRLLVEILAQQVAARRHMLVLATIAVLGVMASVICAIVIAVQVTKANSRSSSSSSSYCTIYSC